MIERERTYLAKYIPEGLRDCPSREIVDIYVPATKEHAVLRIRKNGSIYEITKKTPVAGTDSSEQTEQTVFLDEEEYAVFSTVTGKRIEKRRYYYPLGKQIAEVDIFEGALEGLVIVDVEFDSSEEKNNFQMPDFCLAEVTQERFCAGGVLAGKGYADIEDDLKKFGYEKITGFKD